MRNLIGRGKWGGWLLLILLHLCRGAAPAHAAMLPERLATLSCPSAVCSVTGRFDSGTSHPRLQRRRTAPVSAFRRPGGALFARPVAFCLPVRTLLIFQIAVDGTLSSSSRTLCDIRAPPTLL